MNTIIPVLGGLGLLLYGMTIMGDALQKAVGNKMRNIIGVLTKNKFIGALVGFLVTVLVGSSSATTIMTIGFVNAKIMSLGSAMLRPKTLKVFSTTSTALASMDRTSCSRERSRRLSVMEYTMSTGSPL